MAFEFKRLGEVNALSEMKDGLNVLAVDGSEVMKIDADKIIEAYVSDIVDTSVNQAVEEVLNAEGLEEVNETASILVENNSSLKKVSTDKVVNTAANKAIENILNVDSLEEVGETVNILVEENGSLKKISANAVGDDSVMTVIIKQDGYDDFFAGVATASADPEPTYTYTPSMTYEEVIAAFPNMKAVTAIYMGIDTGTNMVIHAPSTMFAVQPDMTIAMAFAADFIPSVLYWGPWGISTYNPSAPE